ncbi:MAG: Na+/H+ antiporter subunit E [Halothiobacillaceae bacterium]|jgi:multicomponent K+:H+ antiporter subunit E|nr:Na+/H+ antiporter subunit E [Halothiobacillaceae bacterium]MDY0049749.1 Na+/H+ antiporter subunit E [Halothiobacillaceae bacterium]
MKRWLPHPILSLVLALVWLLLVNELSIGQLVLGALLGLLLPLFTRRFWPDPLCIRRPATLARFVGLVLHDIIVANFQVARLILGRPEALQPAFIVVPLALKTDIAISLLANTICLTPGTLTAELAADRSHLLIHALNAPDPASVVDEIKTRYEAPLKEIFESC